MQGDFFTLLKAIFSPSVEWPPDEDILIGRCHLATKGANSEGRKTERFLERFGGGSVAEAGPSYIKKTLKEGIGTLRKRLVQGILMTLCSPYGGRRI